MTQRRNMDRTSHFDALGLSVYEGRVYTALLKTQEATAPWISRESGVPMSKVYEVLERLWRKGFVLISPDSKPRKYKAIEPSIALEALVEKQKEQIEEAKSYLLTQLNKKPTEQEKSVWVVRGSVAVDSLLTSLLQKAKSSVVYHYTGDRHAGVKKLLQNTAKKGVAVNTKPSDIAANVITIDGRDLVVFADKKEALWIRNPKYCRVTPPSVKNLESTSFASQK